ncbi:MAG TPA: hypothetical protein VGL38_15490 [bacterium]|jgi:hypothetical protein
MISVRFFVSALALVALCSLAFAGVTNPDISVIGQMRTFMTDDRGDSNRNRAQFSFDESEVVADAALNPYAHGTFVFSIANGGVDVEEGYLNIVRGLPSGLAFKAGKYRVGFGRLNPVHPHAYPFIYRFRVLAEYLPGPESYNDVGGQVSYRLPLPGDLSSTISADILQGNTFHPGQSGARPAWVARWANFFSLKDPSSMEVGVSATEGTNDVLHETHTAIYGADAKAKLWFSPLNALILQAEFLAQDRELAAVDSVTGALSKSHIRPLGGYFFADYAYHKRFDGGATYERFQRSEPGKPWEQAVGLFAGFLPMEETTLFRLNWNRIFPASGAASNLYTLQIVWSMGPHKAHQF